MLFTKSPLLKHRGLLFRICVNVLVQEPHCASSLTFTRLLSSVHSTKREVTPFIKKKKAMMITHAKMMNSKSHFPVIKSLRSVCSTTKINLLFKLKM